MMVTKKAISQMDNKELMKQFRNIVLVGMVEANTRRGITKATEKAESMLTEELCLRLGFDYDPDDWKY